MATTNKISKPEKKKRIKEAFAALQPSSDTDALVSIIAEMLVFELDVTRIAEDEYISGSALLKLSPEQLEMIKNPPTMKGTSEGEPAADDSFDKIYFSLKVEDQMALASDIIDSKFIKGRPDTDTIAAGFTFYSVVDPDIKTCKAISEDRGKQIDEIQGVVAQRMISTGTMVRPMTSRDMVDVWRTNTREVSPAVTNCTNSYRFPVIESKPWSLHHSSHVPDASVPFPHLKATLDRMSEGEAFAAFIWGTYTKQYKGRQVFYIWGQEGEEGKSFVAMFMGSELWGTNAGFSSISNVNISKSNQFTMSAFVGADFIVYPDCNNTRFLQTEIVKVVSGGGRDASQVEKKFKDAQTVIIKARLVICSNHPPHVLRDNWYQSRLILSTIEPFSGPKDPEIDKKYLKEMPGFLAYAKECYERLCPTNEAIQTTTHNRALIDKLIDENDPTNRDIFLNYFDLDPTNTMMYRDVKTVLESADIKFTNKDFIEFIQFIEDQEGVTIDIPLGRPAVITGIRRADKKKKASLAKPLSAYEKDVEARKLSGLI